MFLSRGKCTNLTCKTDFTGQNLKVQNYKIEPIDLNMQVSNTKFAGTNLNVQAYKTAAVGTKHSEAHIHERYEIQSLTSSSSST